jgi:amidase
MLRFILVSLYAILIMGSCTSSPPLNKWEKYDETQELRANSEHPIERMRYKRIQSKHSDRNTFFLPFSDALSKFSQVEYDSLKAYILEQDIPTIQRHVQEGRLTYEKLTLFYIYRIYHFELQRDTYLNAIISLNPQVLEQARQRDLNRKEGSPFSIYGMPILLKDNIDAVPMVTTAGAAAMENNYPPKDAFIVRQLKEKGALILGKVNLSEWAYYFCQGCPVGYSAMGGQTLNPYGRRVFETGGSSSGSGVAVAANYAVAAIGSETSGSILSPSGKNSVVGLKPTIGAVSRSGIVPISSSLDTAGPMTKNVIDNALLMSALIGKDSLDRYSFQLDPIRYNHFDTLSLKGKRLGIDRKFEKDSLMQIALTKMQAEGAIVVSFDPPKINMDQFRRLLDVDMRADLPNYFAAFANPEIKLDSVRDVVAFNNADSLLHAPYGQGIFLRITEEKSSQGEFEAQKQILMQTATAYFEEVMDENKLDAILSIDNYSARNAAAAHYPAIGVPMGYTTKGQPQNLTFIAPSKKEQRLLELAAAFERITKSRKMPELFQ